MRPRKILVYIDLSEAARAAAALARTMAETFGSTLEFLRVIESPFAAGWTAEASAASLPEVQEAATIEAREWLEPVLSEEDASRLGGDLHIGTDAPIDEVVRYAGEREADLVVMGTGPDHDSQQDLARAVVGAVTCSVLVVRQTGI